MSLFTEAGLAAIEEAIAGGYLEVEYDNKKIRYRTLDELLRIRNHSPAFGQTDPTPAGFVQYSRENPLTSKAA